MMRRFMFNVFAAFLLAVLGGVIYTAGLVGVDPAEARPRPMPSKTVEHIPVVPLSSPLATILRVEDCPEEGTMDAICVWDASWSGNGRGESLLWVFGVHFHVGYNDDGTVWVDDNHDGEPGYTDS